jgi:putative endonuclease
VKRTRSYYVYILSSRSLRLYIGVTNDLERRVLQHKRRELPGFTSRYNIDRLVYYEEMDDIHDAIAREKQLKGWVRGKKFALIDEMNPTLEDLAADWV